MRHLVLASLLLATLAGPASHAQVPENLVAEGVPAIPADLRADVGRYLEFRSAAFQDWHPKHRQALVTTRFADSAQLHLVRTPGGARHQLTFLPEPVSGGSFQPATARFIVFNQDRGGGEFYQIYRYDLADARVTLLTDGKSRNTFNRWARDGQRFAYTSTRRNGRDTDVYVMDPADPKTDRLVAQLNGGGWSVLDWSPDDRTLLVREYLSINESRLHLLDLATASLKPATPRHEVPVAYANAAFAPDGRSLFVVTDRDSEFLRLGRMSLDGATFTPIPGSSRWGVEDLEISRDGRHLAFLTNEDGVGVLRVLRTSNLKPVSLPPLPQGVITGLKWHSDGRLLGFSLSSARAPGDAYSIDLTSRRLERWTESETGGLDPTTFVEPELIRIPSFDGLPISAFVYRPDPRKFPGKRPVLVNIHGGPEAQSRPIFLARNNYLLNELGVALVVPNVRGSAGYGKSFLTLDNGFKREDSVKDIGTILRWIQNDPGLDRDRIGVIGGSYGGYMVLASLIHFGDSLRCGIDIVGISNFLTFLKNTQDYRRDLRRVEYGDERDPKMREFLERISPTAHANRITKPLFVVQGQNDPRVPVTEAEQMVRAIRDNGGRVWYLMARDEGHGFQKKKNADFQFYSTILFLREHLLN